MAHDYEENDLRVDVELNLDDDMANLFAAFDEVRASDALVNATLARILGASEGDGEGNGEEAADPDSATVSAEASAPATAPAITAVKGGKPAQATKQTGRAKWRAIRVAAIAACLAMALTGGIAYATPASYYDITQNGTTVTLGVNCFGVTVSATSDDAAGDAIVQAADLCNVPYEESLARAIEQMEERDPEAPIEFGPQGGEHEVKRPQIQGDEPSIGAGNASGEPSGVSNASGEPGGAGNAGNAPGDPGGGSGEAGGAGNAPDEPGGAGNASGQPEGTNGPGEPSGASASGEPSGTGAPSEPTEPNSPEPSSAPGSQNAPDNPSGTNSANAPDSTRHE